MNWVVDAQDSVSCYGGYTNEHFASSQVKCRIVILYTRQLRQLFVVVFPGVWVLAGGEFYTSLGLPYWQYLIHLIRPFHLPTRRAILIRFAVEVIFFFPELYSSVYPSTFQLLKSRGFVLSEPLFGSIWLWLGGSSSFFFFLQLSPVLEVLSRLAVLGTTTFYFIEVSTIH